jgi:hypothetical protein
MIMFRGDWLRFFSDSTTLVLFCLSLITLSIPVMQRFLSGRRT